jgi:thiosulfate/3-mercaptopyruvate sulfurtransferase
MNALLFRSTIRLTKDIPKAANIMSIRYSSTSSPLTSYLVSPKELSGALSSSPKDDGSRIIPLCAAWFLPNDPQKRTGQKVFEEKRIPTALFFDIDAVKDESSPYPHMLPTAEGFAKAMSNLGIKRDDRLVVYDSAELGIFSAPRAAWTLKVFGHPHVHILNNFRLWLEQGLPTESGKAKDLEQTSYPIPDFNPDRVASFRDIKLLAKEFGKESAENVQIIDARSAGRFSGKESEPRPGLSSGHIPGSYNVPLPEILDPNTKAFLPANELRKVFEGKGLDPAQPIITTCGTGVMAAALDAALAEANFGEESNRKVYDGSWT